MVNLFIKVSKLFMMIKNRLQYANRKSIYYPKYNSLYNNIGYYSINKIK